MDPYPPISSPAPPAVAIAPAWEDRARPLLSRWWVTVRDVLMHPVRFFEAMRPRGGIVSPLVFAVIGGSIPVVVSALSNLRYSCAAGDSPAPETPWTGAVNFASGPLAGVGSVLLAPLWFAVLVCLEAALVHGALILFGGARRRFETTFRVVAYAAGATLLLSVTPVMGSAASLAWLCVAVTLGLTRAHGITTGRAATATLVPLVLVGCCALMPVLLLGALPSLGSLGAGGAPT